MAVPSVLVVAAGADVGRLAAAEPSDLVICADGGLDVALAARRRVDLVVGDLDSVTDDARAAAAAAGATIERHPPDKDESDLELALHAALARGAVDVRVHLAAGGRLDHQLANLLVLGSPRWAAASVSAVVGHDRVWVVHDERVIPLEVGAPIALHALGGRAEGVRTEGLRFELDDEPLEAMVARGISNEVRITPPRVSVRDGVVLVIAPVGD